MNNEQRDELMNSMHADLLAVRRKYKQKGLPESEIIIGLGAFFVVLSKDVSGIGRTAVRLQQMINSLHESSESPRLTVIDSATGATKH